MSIDSEPQYFCLVGDFVIKKREIKRRKKSVAGSSSSLRDFCVVTLSLIFTVVSTCFVVAGEICLQINFFL